MLLCLGLGLNLSAAINKHFPGQNTYDLVVLAGSILLFVAAFLMWRAKSEK